MRPALLWLLIACCAGIAFVAQPRRYAIDGLSMAPALLPGDIVSTGWLPLVARRDKPRRFDRWLLAAPDGQPAVKRVIGLPGEAVAFVDGDLAIEGQVVLTPPWVLAEVASRVAECGTDSGPENGVWQRLFRVAVVWDEAPFAPAESRRLTSCRDLGIAAIIAANPGRPIGVAARVGGRAIRWSLDSSARYAIVAGRLDRRLVAAAWPLPRGATSGAVRSALPPSPPQSWSVVEAWSEMAEAPSAVALSLTRDGVPISAAECDRLLVSCTVWRDIVHLPPAAGTTAWSVGPESVFVLGDFPAGSRDSRHWGPLPTAALRSPIDHQHGEPSPTR